MAFLGRYAWTVHPGNYVSAEAARKTSGCQCFAWMASTSHRFHGLLAHTFSPVRFRTRRDRSHSFPPRLPDGAGRHGLQTSREYLPRRPVPALDQGQELAASGIQPRAGSVRLSRAECPLLGDVCSKSVQAHRRISTLQLVPRLPGTIAGARRRFGGGASLCLHPGVARAVPQLSKLWLGILRELGRPYFSGARTATRFRADLDRI